MTEKETGGPAFPTPDSDIAWGTQGMTLRQYAAIKLKVPNSGTDWLDEMILESLRNEFAGQALVGLMFDGAISSETAARWAYEAALAKRSKRGVSDALVL